MGLVANFNARLIVYRVQMVLDVKLVKRVFTEPVAKRCVQ